MLLLLALLAIPFPSTAAAAHGKDAFDSANLAVDCHFVLHDHCNIEVSLEGIRGDAAEALRTLHIRVDGHNVNLMPGSFAGTVRSRNKARSRVQSFASLLHIHHDMIAIYPHSPSIQARPLPKEKIGLPENTHSLHASSRDIPFLVDDLTKKRGSILFTLYGAGNRQLASVTVVMVPNHGCWLDQDECVRRMHDKGSD